MSNEELALIIQERRQEYCCQLWNQVEKFIAMKARQFERHLTGSSADMEDLKQSGYLAMLDAVGYYRPAKGYRFLTYLNKTVKKRFCTVAGIRTTYRDATRYAASLDAPVSETEDLSLTQLRINAPRPR